jgi:hypothetical protein
MKRPAAGTLGFEAARTRLGLTRWQLRLAVASGLLARDAEGRLEEAKIEACATGLAAFLADLRDQERLVPWEAAELLEISIGRFREAVTAGLFVPVETKPFRRGTTRYFRRGDLIDGRDALAAWLAQRSPVHVPSDSWAALARKARRAATTALTRHARTLFIAERQALASLSPSEREVGAIAFWLSMLEGHRMYLNHLADRSRRPRVAVRYRMLSAALNPARDAALEALVLTGRPLVNVRIGGRNVQIAYCPACLPDPAAAEAIEFPPPGCPNCGVELADCFLRVEIGLSSGLRTFSVPLSDAAAFIASGRLDPAPVQIPSPFLVGNISSAFSMLIGIKRPSSLALGAWLALDYNQRQAAMAAEVQRRLAVYASGQVPHESLPRWLGALPHDGGPTPQVAAALTATVARAVGPGEIAAGLADAVERIAGFRPPLLMLPNRTRIQT